MDSFNRIEQGQWHLIIQRMVTRPGHADGSPEYRLAWVNRVVCSATRQNPFIALRALEPRVDKVERMGSKIEDHLDDMMQPGPGKVVASKDR
jgi:hypothetical protein